MPGFRLCLGEREEIRVGLERGWSFGEIARWLGRIPSTVPREAAGNGGRVGYRAVGAQERADRLAARPKPFRLVIDREFAREVERLLGMRYAPQTCVRLLAERGWRIIHETIYQACYQSGRGLVPDAYKLLVRRRQRRKHAGRRWGIASGNPLGEPVYVSQRHRPFSPAARPAISKAT